jgi:hypothetical protein
MNKPASYMGSATFSGSVSAFSKALDPRNWQRNAPQIWQASYPIDSSPLAPDRSVAPTPAAGDPGTSDAGGLFFEEVLFGGFTYRNVLTMSYKEDLAAASPSIKIEYGQYGCLNTKTSTTLEDGGIDVDNGFIECIPKGVGQVKVSISKSVRFTKPSEFVDDVNVLAHVLVPLALDVLLHSLIFQT